MAKVLNPLMSSEAHGSVGGLTYKNHRGLRVVESRPISRKLDREAVRIAQGALKLSNLAWQSMDETTRDIWRRLAPPHSHGQAEFVGRYCKILRLDPEAPAPTTGSRHIPNPVITSASRAAGPPPTITVTWTPIVDDDLYLVLRGVSRPSPGANPDYKRIIWLGFAPIGDGTLTISPDPFACHHISIYTSVLSKTYGTESVPQRRDLAGLEGIPCIQGPNFPTDEEDLLDRDAPWYAIDAIELLDAVFAEGMAPESSLCNTLVGKAFAFAVPLTATITGVLARVFIYSADTGTTYLQLVVAGAPTGTIIELPNSLDPTFWASGGGISSLWGLALTPAIVNSSGFGLAYWVLDASGSGQPIYPDVYELTVYYTT